MADRSELYKSVFSLEEKVRQSLEGRVGSSGKLRRLKLLLLQVLELDYVDSVLKRAVERVHGGKTLLNTIVKRVEANEFAVLKAIYDHIHMGAGLKSACLRWGCRPSDVMAAKRLSKSLGRALGSFTVEDQLEDYGCLSEVIAAREEILVDLSRRAFEDMVLPTLEGYQVPKTTKSRFTEVYGLCLGTIRGEKITRRGGGGYRRDYVNVQQAAVQLRAKATKDHVWPNTKSLAIQLAAAKVLFPHLEVIGDFHSHPYNSARSVCRRKGWEPSEEDEDFNRGWVKTMKDYSHVGGGQVYFLGMTSHEENQGS